MPQDKYDSKLRENLPQFRSDVLIALGSNAQSEVGSPLETVARAIELLAENGVVIRGKSRFFSTPAFPAGAGADFVNAALSCDVPWSAAETLEALHRIEASMGRRRRRRWAPRTIDLDLLAYGDKILPDAVFHRKWRDMPLEQQVEQAPDQMILPHPRLQERAFVLVPLAEVAADWVHPALGLSVRDMLAALPEEAAKEVKPI